MSTDVGANPSGDAVFHNQHPSQAHDQPQTSIAGAPPQQLQYHYNMHPSQQQGQTYQTTNNPYGVQGQHQHQQQQQHGNAHMGASSANNYGTGFVPQQQQLPGAAANKNMPFFQPQPQPQHQQQQQVGGPYTYGGEQQQQSQRGGYPVQGANYVPQPMGMARPYGGHGGPAHGFQHGGLAGQRHPRRGSATNSGGGRGGGGNGNGNTRRSSAGGGGRGGGARRPQVHNSHSYNQQHHYSSNNAVPEKTPTVHVRHPGTDRVLSVKLNRIYSTMADVREQLQQTQPPKPSEAPAEDKDGREEREVTEPAPLPPFDRSTTKLVLCLDFLSEQGCPHGSGCDKLHIAGVEYTWETIEPTTVVRDIKKMKNYDNGEKEIVTEKETMYLAGFQVRCYDPTLTKYYSIPSDCTIETEGSTQFIAMFNLHGDNFKAKFKLCEELISEGLCGRKSACPDIHCLLSHFEQLEQSHSNPTHVNDAEAMEDEPRLLAEMQVRVFEPNSNDRFRDYSGDFVLVTQGAKEYQKHYDLEGGKIPPRKRMQHCAHFRLKGMCRNGGSCRFLHALFTPEEIAEKAADDARKVYA